jgi:hypothetical protein
MKKLSFTILLAVLSLYSLKSLSDLYNTTDPSNGNVGVIRPGDPGTSKQTHTPGFGWGGIPFNDSSLYEIPPEKCSGKSSAEIVGEYGLTEKFYVFKTERGYGVISLEQTLKELETGVRRRKTCPIAKGLKLNGEIDCRGVRVIKADPEDGCAYEAKVWGHSLNESGAFALAYDKLQGQFKEYKAKCIAPPKGKTLQERMVKF